MSAIQSITQNILIHGMQLNYKHPYYFSPWHTVYHTNYCNLRRIHFVTQIVLIHAIRPITQIVRIHGMQSSTQIIVSIIRVKILGCCGYLAFVSGDHLWCVRLH